MSDDGHEISEEDKDRLAEVLAEIDDARLIGNGPPADVEDVLDLELRPELDRDLSFLRYIECVWPRATDGTTIADEPATSPRDVNELLGIEKPSSRSLPDNFGRFEILRTLGQGGSGVVLLARDPTLNRRVALKLPQPEVFASPNARSRFSREARAAAALDHPNIIPVYETGNIGPVSYIASTFCDGPNLAEWLESQGGEPIPIRDAAQLVIGLARGVQHAHERGVLHRDLKPSNVLLQKVVLRDDDVPVDTDRLSGFVPRLTDFSLARIVHDDGTRTRSGIPFGSPPYMAPEQAEGKPSEMGPPTDVYGLGCILYVLLVGRPPFAGESQIEILKRVVVEEPVSPRKLRRDIPTPLESVVLRCLEKDPAKRYGSAAELADDRGRFLAGEPTLACPPSALVLMARHLHLHRLAVAASGLVAIFFAVAIAESRWYVSRDEEREIGARRDRYLINMIQARQSWDRADVAATLFHLDGELPSPGAADLRGFMWYYLWRQCHLDRRVFQVRAPATSVAFSPDGRTLAFAATDGSVNVRDAETGEVRVTIAGHTAGVTCVAFSPDGTRLVSTGDDEVARIWDLATGDPRGVLKGHRGHLSYADISPDGKLLATCGTDQTIKLWDMASLAEVATLRGHAGDINSVHFSRDGRYVASAGDDATIRVWETATRRPLVTFEGHVGIVTDLAFSPRGDLLASCSDDHTIRLWNLAVGRETLRLTGHTRRVLSLAFCSDGEILTAASNDGAIRFWDLATAQEIPGLKGHTGAISSVAVSADGRFLATASHDSTAKLWDSPRRERHILGGYTGRVTGVAFSPDGLQLATASEHDLKVSDPATGLELFRLDVGMSFPTAIAFSPDGKDLAVGESDGRISLWDLRSRSKLKTFAGHSSCIQRVTYSRDGDLLASCGDDQMVRVWNARTWREIASLQGHTAQVDCVAFSPDGRTLASSGRDASARLWDLGTHAQQALFGGHGKYTRSLAFSPDGRTLATGSSNTHIRLWDVVDRRLRSTLRGHAEQVESLAFSPDGAFLASGSNDRTARLWDLATGLEAARLTGHSGQVDVIALSPDGRRLATAGGDKTVRLWDVAPATPEEILIRDRLEAASVHPAAP